MYYDLRVNRTKEHLAQVQQKMLVIGAIKDEYKAIAFTQNIHDKTIKNQVNTSKSIKTLKNLKFNKPKNYNAQAEYLHQLNLQKQKLNAFDLISIQPKNQKIFHSICVEYEMFDIITFDLAQKIPFMLKRNPVYQAIRKGLFFQITYSDSISNPNKRVNIFANIINIIKITKGKNLIISSNAYQHIFHRSPYDIVALQYIIISMSVLGLNRDKAFHAIKQNTEKCLKRARFRKSYKGTIVQADEKDLIQFKQKKSKRMIKLKKMQKKREQDSKIELIQ